MKMVDIPPVWLVGFIALVWIQDRYIPTTPFAPGLFRPLGLVLIVMGVAAMVLAMVQFLRHRTSVIPHKMPKAILTGGIFAVSRNPIYLGDVMVLLGIVLIWGAMPSLILVPVFAILIERRFIRDEESRLQQAFPEEFEAYRAQVRRWI